MTEDVKSKIANFPDDNVRQLLAEKGLPCSQEALDEWHRIRNACASSYNPEQMVTTNPLGNLIVMAVKFIQSMFGGIKGGLANIDFGDLLKTSGGTASDTAKQTAADDMTRTMYTHLAQSRHLSAIAEELSGQHPLLPGQPRRAAINHPLSFYHAVKVGGVTDTSLNLNPRHRPEPLDVPVPPASKEAEDLRVATNTNYQPESVTTITSPPVTPPGSTAALTAGRS